jgi:prophage antirepressor-like protein
MDKELKIYENKDFGIVRALNIDGQPWFIGKDISCALNYKYYGDALKAHVDKDDKVVATIHDGIRNRKMIIVNEYGLFSLILSSKMPLVKAFKHWVTSEILPSIKRYGAFILKDKPAYIHETPVTAINVFTTLKLDQNNKNSLKGNDDISETINYNEIINQCKKSIPVSIIAKDYGITALSFNKLLHGLGIQYCVSGTWLLYQKHCGQDYTITRTYHINDTKSSVHMYWTQKGRMFIYETLKNYGVLPDAEKAAHHV